MSSIFHTVVSPYVAAVCRLLIESAMKTQLVFSDRSAHPPGPTRHSIRKLAGFKPGEGQDVVD